MMTTSTSLSESRFTEADEFCPNPEHWSAEDSSSAEGEVADLLYALIRAQKPLYVVETGTYKGRTSKVIGLALKENGVGKLDTMEIKDYRCDIARERCKELPVTVLCMSSMDFIPKQEIDLLFIDSHFPLRAQEFHKFKPYLKESSIICFHDTAPRFSGVEAFTTELASELQQVTVHSPRGLTICQLKKGEA